MLELTKLDNDTIWIVCINRPKVRNCVDGKTALELYKTFKEFDKDEKSKVAILMGKGGNFCAGADLNFGNGNEGNPLELFGDLGPMGISRLNLSKPLIGSIEGYAVAGGLELACLCDFRVLSKNAILSVSCRRFGVPLIDGGTVRLPAIIGLGRSLDLILTARLVNAEECLQMGLANYVVADPLEKSIELARLMCKFPNACMLSDRESLYRNLHSNNTSEALRDEFALGMRVMKEASEGARRFINDKVGRSGNLSNL